ncbi:MAG: polysaccharide biosynthesis tyrosine autokinase [Muribaculaceae bacterium]|nr:polysaccharide biosynthesis tyrosine autokinase [Muribaculaceae bacterium]
MATFNTPPTAQQEEQIIDFSTFVRKYKRYWWLFLLSIIACFAIAFAYLKYAKRVYNVTSVVLVAQEDNSAGAGANLLKSMKLMGQGGKVDDEMIVFSSQELCTQVVKQLKLNRSYIEDKGWFVPKREHYNSSPIEVVAPEEMFDTLSSVKFKIDVDKQGLANIKVNSGKHELADIKGATLPTTIKTSYGVFAVQATTKFKPGKPCHIQASLMGNQLYGERLNRLIKVKLVTKKSNGINLSIAETNKSRGIDILNKLMELYNERGQQEKDVEAINTAKFIDERLALIYKGLTSSEADIEAYKRAHKIVDPELQVKSTIAKQEKADQAIIKLETNKQLLGMVRDFVSNPSNKHSFIPFDVDSSAASGPIKAYNNLLVKRQELAQSAKDDNMILKQIDEQIETMHNNVLHGVNTSIRGLDMQLAKVRGQANESAGELSMMPTEEREARELMRQQGIQNTLYTFLLQKREENSLVLAATTPKGKIVDHAYAHNTPISPNFMVTMALALLASILLPLLLVYLKDLFTTKFSNQEELEEISQVPFIGHIHHNRHNTQLVVKDGKTSSIVELFRYVRNNLQFLLNKEDDKVILVTSSVSGEGKSFISTNIASSFALLGKRVALVGMDIRSPKLATMLDLNEMPGVTSYLSRSDISLEQVAQPCKEVKGLDVFVGGAIPPNPSELLLGDRVKDLFRDLRAQYDVIIVDSAPVAMVSDSFALDKYSNATVYVTRANYTRRNHIKFMNRIAANKQLKNMCVVLNDTKPSGDNTYGYGYGKTKDDE